MDSATESKKVDEPIGTSNETSCDKKDQSPISLINNEHDLIHQSLSRPLNLSGIPSVPSYMASAIFMPTPLLPGVMSSTFLPSPFSGCMPSNATIVSAGTATFSSTITTAGGTNGASSSGGKRSGSNSPNLTCAVCNDVSSGKHYGILACNGCSGFFKRSVRRKLIYRCQAGTGTCIVDKAHRNQCQACRLKKCLQQGMNKEAVQNERQPRNTATIRPPLGMDFGSASEQFFREYTGAVSAAVGVFGHSVCPPCHPGPFTPFVLSAKAAAETISTTSSDNVIRSATSTSVGTTKCEIVDDGSQDDNSDSGADEPSNKDPSPEARHSSTVTSRSLPVSNSISNILCSAPSPAHETIYETSARLLYMAVKWAKNLPSFTSLPFRDQVILLEEGWNDLFLLSVFQWSMPMETCPLLAAPLFPEIASGSVKPSDMRYLHDLFIRFRSYAIDPAEFACLKAIVLFRPEARGLKDPHQVEYLQDQAQSMLAQHARVQQPTPPLRFGRLLLMLPLLRTVGAEKLELLFFHRTTANMPMEKLLCDMYKS